MAENELEWNQEQERVDQVKKEINNKIEKLEVKTAGLKEAILDIRKTFFDDITVNVEDAKERVETEAAIRQQQEFLSERERNQGVINKQIKTLLRMENSPYFGRIDFLEKDEDKPEKIYIGIASLMDHTEEDFLVYDWRAPISSLYYDYSPGPANYLTMEGMIHGEMELKRQFIIRNSTIKGMFDTGITIGDQLLQEVLGNAANTKMKSIVATIQKEQNKIIRHEKNRFLVVQGVAGSGKTSAALQRVAYLLYRYRESMSADNIILLSPNPLFNSYVATVLPELGEENMEQETLQGFIEAQLESKLLLEGPTEQMEYYLSEKDGEEYQNKLKGIEFKSGLEFMNLIDHYIEHLSHDELPFTTIIFQKRKLVTAEQMKEYFYQLDSSIPIPNRMELTKDWLVKELKRLERKERDKDWVSEEMELLSKEDYVAVHKKLEEKQKSEDYFNDFEREELLLRRMIVRKKFTPLLRSIKKLDFINTTQVYRNLFVKWSNIGGQPINIPDSWQEICQETVEKLDEKRLSWEDAVPFLYVRDLIKGRNENRIIRHVFIDEAQDYSPFQFSYLKEIFPASKMTILGDFNQAIYAHTAGKMTLLSDSLYDNENVEKVTLTRSYRSTRPIVEYTKDLIENGEMIEPFNRNGSLPEVIQVDGFDSLHTNIVEKIEGIQAKGHQTIAVICKTMDECKSAYTILKQKMNVKLMTKGTNQFKRGILIIPVYLAKGIEFDAVLLYNASEEIYHRDRERNLFYTACTRAMHELVIFTVGSENKFMKQVANEKYLFTKLVQKNNDDRK